LLCYSEWSSGNTGMFFNFAGQWFINFATNGAAV